MLIEKPGGETKTRFESVLLQMREMILSGELPPGSRVQEIALGERLGVSRTPVRLSLGVLEQEGLVRGEPNRGFIVREFSADDVLAAYDVRSILEGYACRIVAAHGLAPAEEQALADCITLGESLLQAGYFDSAVVREWTEMNGCFHAVIIEASRNLALGSAIGLVNRHPLAAPSSIIFRTNNLDRLFGAMCRAQQEHAALLQALRQRETMRAEALMAEHIYQSREVVRREIQETGPDRPGFFPRLSRPDPVL